MRRIERTCLAGVVAVGAVLVVPAAAHAQEPAPETAPQAPAARPGDTVGWHVVREGETLQRITEHYLGTPQLWRENWRLNPGLQNPHLILPGQRIRVILDRPVPARTAEVAQISRRVEEKPQPNPWIPAREGDLLHEEDGVRTFARSSAELAFDDGSRLQLTEDSLVFLRRLDATLVGGRKQTIEVVVGQADLAARQAPQAASDIEIVIGEATARPQVGAEGLVESRARRVGGGDEEDEAAAAVGAQLMVYQGRSEVEAAGAKVAVGKGMGTSVPAGGPPSPPERLLPAPRATAPAAGSRWNFANPRIAWSPVAGAASYVVEVCFDAACARLAERAGGLAEAAWEPPALPSGDLHWRVTAVAASGLDGYPAATVPFTVLSDRPDREPPVVAVLLRGAGRVGTEGAVVVGQGGALLPAAHDDASGVAEVAYRWDGGPWRSWTGDALPPPGGGDHLLELKATDRMGRESGIWRIEVMVDPTPPAPPAVRSGPAG